MEEDIKILEEFKEKGYTLLYLKYGDRVRTNLRIERAIENLIKGYRELEKSKITYERARDLQEENKRIVDNNYIPTSKIKEKIEELEQWLDNGKYARYGLNVYELEAQKEVLQELMEDK